MRALIIASFLIAVPASAQVVVPPGSAWRSLATGDDRRRVRNWRDAWMAALAQVRAGSDAGEIERDAALFAPDMSLPNPAPPPGNYRCRTIKLGSSQPGLLDYNAYPAFRCRIRMRGGRLELTKLSGSQRPAGIFFRDNSRRMIFLGTLLLGDETRALRYGRDRERDLIGLLERVGDRRWRIAFPYPHFESLLDVIELVPSH